MKKLNNTKIIKLSIGILMIIVGIVVTIIAINIKIQEVPKDKIRPLRNYNPTFCKNNTETFDTYLNTYDNKRLYFKLPNCLTEKEPITFNRVFYSKDGKITIKYNYIPLLLISEYYNEFNQLVVSKKGPIQEEKNVFMQQFRTEKEDTYHILKKIDNDNYLNVVITAKEYNISLDMIQRLLDIKSIEKGVSFKKTKTEGNHQIGSLFIFKKPNYKKGLRVDVDFPTNILEREIILMDKTIRLERNLFDQIVEINVELFEKSDTGCNKITRSDVVSEEITFVYYIENNKQLMKGCKSIDKDIYYTVEIISKNKELEFSTLKEYFNINVTPYNK